MPLLLHSSGAGQHIRWTLRERSAERADIRRAALLNQRATDLRELGSTLPDIQAAAKEVIWERVVTDELMPKSDPRSMHLTQLVQRTKFLRVVVGDEELRGLVGEVLSTAEKLSNSNSGDTHKDTVSANQALTAALDRVAHLLRAVRDGIAPWAALLGVQQAESSSDRAKLQTSKSWRESGG